MNPAYLDWKISPKIERYRVLGLGERDPEYEGSFIFPVSTTFFDDGRFRNRRRRMHIVTRVFFNNEASDRRGIGKKYVVAAATAIGRGGELLPVIYEEVVLLKRRLVAAKVPEPKYYETGLGRREYYSRGDMMWASMLCNNLPPIVLNVRDMHTWNHAARARGVVEQIFEGSVPDFAGYILFGIHSTSLTTICPRIRFK